LELRGGERTVEHILAVELRGRCNAVHFREQLLRFAVQRLAIGRRVRRVRGLYRQFANTLQNIAVFAERAFRCLRQRDRVVGVTRGLVEPLICVVNRVAMARPAASSFALLMRKPDDRRCRDVANDCCEVVKLRCALSEATLVLMTSDMDTIS